MPVCTLTSVLTNTSQLAQRTPGQPGRHSTGCGHRLASQEWTCKSGDIQTNQKRVTVASGRLCNIYWSAPLWTLPALPKTRHWKGTIWHWHATGKGQEWWWSMMIRLCPHHTFENSPRPIACVHTGSIIFRCSLGGREQFTIVLDRSPLSCRRSKHTALWPS